MLYFFCCLSRGTPVPRVLSCPARRTSRAVPLAVALAAIHTCSAAMAQTGTATSARAASAKPPATVPYDVNSLLANVRSPGAVLPHQAAKNLLKMYETMGEELLEIAKKQVLDARTAKEKLENPAVKVTYAEQEKQLAIVLQKDAIASATILRLLGNLHVEAAVPFLLKNIDFQDGRQDMRNEFFPYRYPCLGALILIGLPATASTLRAIEEASMSDSSVWGEEILGRTLGPYAAAGCIED